MQRKLAKLLVEYLSLVLFPAGRKMHVPELVEEATMLKTSLPFSDAGSKAAVPTNTAHGDTCLLFIFLPHNVSTTQRMAHEWNDAPLPFPC